jgi:hypothetical protein
MVVRRPAYWQLHRRTTNLCVVCRSRMLLTEVTLQSGELSVQSSSRSAAEPTLHMRCSAGCCKAVQQPAPAAMDSGASSRQPGDAAVAAAATLLRGFLSAGTPHVARQLAAVSVSKAAASGGLPSAGFHSGCPHMVAEHDAASCTSVRQDWHHLKSAAV